MIASNQALNSLLDEWMRYYLAELRFMSWPCISICQRIIEVGRTGIFSTGTRYLDKTIDDLPPHIQYVHEAINTLPPIQQKVIKMEYGEGGTKQFKAKKLKISYCNYRKQLCQARRTLTITLGLDRESQIML